MKKITSLLIALLLVTALAVPAFAADSTITYSGRGQFDFAVGSDEYTTTDLFDGFKGVMPGDVLKETITIHNTSRSCDYIKVYLRAELHDEQENPLSPNVDKTGESVASMSDFLSQMNLIVVNEASSTPVVFSGAPSELDGLANKVYLGSIRRNKSITLNADLYVPITMGNEYANRTGEVDWIITVEEHKDHSNGPATGDETAIMPYVLMLAAGVTGMAILLIGRRRRRS